MTLNFSSRIKTKILELKQKIEFKRFYLLIFFDSWFSYYPFEIFWFSGFCSDSNYLFSVYIPLPFFRDDIYYLDYHEYNQSIIERLQFMEDSEDNHFI